MSKTQLAPHQIDGERAGQLFVEVSSAVRAWLVERTGQDGLVALLSTLDPEDLGYISLSTSNLQLPTTTDDDPFGSWKLVLGVDCMMAGFIHL